MLAVLEDDFAVLDPPQHERDRTLTCRVSNEGEFAVGKITDLHVLDLLRLTLSDRATDSNKHLADEQPTFTRARLGVVTRPTAREPSELLYVRLGRTGRVVYESGERDAD